MYVRITYLLEQAKPLDDFNTKFQVLFMKFFHQFSTYSFPQGSQLPPTDVSSPHQKCECPIEESRAFQKECCQVEWGLYRRSMWDKLDSYDVNKDRLFYEIDKRSHFCDFFEDPECIHGFPRRNWGKAEEGGGKGWQKHEKKDAGELAKGRDSEEEEGGSDQSGQSSINEDGGSDNGGGNNAGGSASSKVLLKSQLHIFHGEFPRRKRLKLVLVQRMEKYKRCITNLDELLGYFSNFNVSVLVVFMEQLTPTTQYYLARAADVWMGVTGRKTLLIEICQSSRWLLLWTLHFTKVSTL